MSYLYRRDASVVNWWLQYWTVCHHPLHCTGSQYIHCHWTTTFNLNFLQDKWISLTILWNALSLHWYCIQFGVFDNLSLPQVILTNKNAKLVKFYLKLYSIPSSYYVRKVLWKIEFLTFMYHKELFALRIQNKKQHTCIKIKLF